MDWWHEIRKERVDLRSNYILNVSWLCETARTTNPINRKSTPLPSTASRRPLHYFSFRTAGRRGLLHLLHAAPRIPPLYQLERVQSRHGPQFHTHLHTTNLIRLRWGHRTVILMWLSVEYYDQVSNNKPATVLYLIAKLIYFPNAVFFSH